MKPILYYIQKWRGDIPVTDNQIIAVFNERHPETLKDIQALGLDPQFIGTGSSRKVYRLTETMVVKIPYYNSTQNAQEILVIERVNREPELEHLRPHTPEMFYGNKKTGVSLMKYYKPISSYSSVDRETEEVRKRFFEIGVYDLGGNNFRLDTDDTIVAVDLGCASEPVPEND